MVIQASITKAKPLDHQLGVFQFTLCTIGPSTQSALRVGNRPSAIVRVTQGWYLVVSKSVQRQAEGCCCYASKEITFVVMLNFFLICTMVTKT